MAVRPGSFTRVPHPGGLAGTSGEACGRGRDRLRASGRPPRRAGGRGCPSSPSPTRAARSRWASPPPPTGLSGLDVSSLLSATDHVTLDAGFKNTASCASAITYIDGDAGILRYRGYPIEQLAGQCLVHRGVLPAHLRRAADARRAHRVPGRRSAGTRCSTRTCKLVLRRVPARRAPDGGAVVRGQRAVGLLPGQPRPVRPRAGRDLDRAAAGQGADHRRLRLQEVDRAAVPLPGQLARATSTTSCG